MVVSGLGPKDSREPDVRCARFIGRCGVVLGAAAVLAVGFPARGEDAAREFEILFGREVKRVQRTPGTRDDAELAGRVLAAAGKAKAGSALPIAVSASLKAVIASRKAVTALLKAVTASLLAVIAHMKGLMWVYGRRKRIVKPLL